MEKIQIDHFLPLEGRLQQFPSEFIETHWAVKLQESDDHIVIGVIANPSKKLESLFTTFFPEKSITYGLIEKAEIISLIEKQVTSSGGETEKKTDIESDVHDLNARANDAPIINKVNALIIEALHLRASDIHIEEYRGHGIVRFRIDGVLVEQEQLDKSILPAIVSRIKLMAHMNILERRLPQDGRAVITFDEHDVDIRVSLVPMLDGESLVMRLLPLDHERIHLQQLGFSQETEKAIKQFMLHPYGLIVVTGPTGSGKTTTLHAIIQELYTPEKKIITIEDPVEYTLPGIVQIQTKETIGLTFDVLLRRVLRQDPDIIMVGEIRDMQTAELAVRAALTGHLVLTTLHTNDAISVFTRLIDMDIPRYLVATVLRGIIAQRLVRTVCPDCKGEAGDTQCSHCKGHGYVGRTAIGESITVEEGLEDLVISNASRNEIADYCKAHGFTPLERHGKEKVQEGVTTDQELLRVTGGSN